MPIYTVHILLSVSSRDEYMSIPTLPILEVQNPVQKPHIVLAENITKSEECGIEVSEEEEEDTQETDTTPLVGVECISDDEEDAGHGIA